MILSGKSIIDAVKQKLIGISPFVEENIKDASYNFTLAPKLLVGEEEITIGTEGYYLGSGEFVNGYTHEHLTLNGKYACFLSTRGSCAQMGLHVLLGSIFAEPDTDNPQKLEIHNVSKNDILLQSGMKIVKGIFVEIR